MNSKDEVIDRLRETFAIIGCNNWEWNIPQKTLHLVNNTHDEMINLLMEHLELKDGLIVNFPQGLQDTELIPRKYSELVIGHVRRIIKGELTGDFKFEIPFTNSAGNTAWIRVQGRIYNDAQGMPAYALGSYTEFTERRRERMESRLEQRILRSLRKSALIDVRADLTADLLFEPDGSTFSICSRQGESRTYTQFLQEELCGDAVEAHAQQLARFASRDRLLRLFAGGTVVDNIDYQRRCDNTWVRLTVHLDLEEDVERVVGYFFVVSIEKSASYHKELETMARMDALTGLCNRHSFEPMVHDYLDSEPDSAALMIIDVDDFKNVNDSLGHTAGDAVLQHLGSVINQCFPQEDNLCCRFGGDEFVCLLKGATKESIAADLELFFAQARKPVQLGNGTFSASVSVGYAMFPGDASTFEQLISLADIALYATKENGKNTALAYKPAMDESMSNRLSVDLRSLSSALPGGILVHAVNTAGTLHYASRRTIELFGCASFAELRRFCNDSYANLIFEEDRAEAITHNVAQMLRNLDNETGESTAQGKFRGITSSGDVIPLQVFMHKVRNKKFGDLIYAFIVEDNQ